MLMRCGCVPSDLRKGSLSLAPLLCSRSALPATHCQKVSLLLSRSISTPLPGLAEVTVQTGGSVSRDVSLGRVELCAPAKSPISRTLLCAAGGSPAVEGGRRSAQLPLHRVNEWHALLVAAARGVVVAMYRCPHPE